MPRMKQRTPELAAAVLDAAVELVEADGVDALTARRLAAAAGTSPAAIYELYGDKAGVVRALFFAGFRMLGASLSASALPDDPVEALVELAARQRAWVVAHPRLAALMFSRSYASYDPGPAERPAGLSVREQIVAAVGRAVAEGALRGDVVDIAHAYVAIVHGLAAAELSDRLGSSAASVTRRWDVAVRALLAGFAAR